MQDEGGNAVPGIGGGGVDGAHKAAGMHGSANGGVRAHGGAARPGLQGRDGAPGRGDPGPFLAHARARRTLCHAAGVLPQPPQKSPLCSSDQHNERNSNCLYVVSQTPDHSFEASRLDDPALQ